MTAFKIANYDLQPTALAATDNGDGTVTLNVNMTGGAATSLSDVLLTDSTGALFIGRDNGTAITFYNLNTHAAYTPTGTIQIADTIAMGTDNTGIAQPSGGLGVRGWLSAIFQKLGSLLSVSDTQSAPVAGSVTLAPSDSTALTPGRGLGIVCTTAGNVTVAFSDASTMTVPVTVGYQQFPFAVAKLMATGTTAVATYYNLK